LNRKYIFNSQAQKIWIGISLILALSGCISGREFWTYVVNDSVTKPLPPRELGKKDAPQIYSQDVVRVVYSDGAAQTEVFIPILMSGQQILIDQKSSQSPVGLALVPYAPTAADKTLEESYLRSGHAMNSKAPAVSILKTQEMIRKFLKSGDYAIALQYAEQILGRYPNHVETLRTKGSLLLKIGERDGALETYRKAQDIEPNAQVGEQIKKLESRIDQP
jgi:tetratricopeptide (TPR) repeat protein